VKAPKIQKGQKRGPKLQEKLTLAGFKRGEKSSEKVVKILVNFTAKKRAKSPPKKGPNHRQKKGQITAKSPPKKGQITAKKRAKKRAKSPPKKGPKVPEKCLRLYI